MNYSKFFNMPNCTIPEDIAQTIKNGGNITSTCFDDKNSILSDKKLQEQTGFIKTADGNYLVSMFCEMPDVTKEMVDWWFWWHAKENDRYRLWYPGEHIKIGFAKKNKNYFYAESQPPFEENTHYPVEKIGKIMLPLAISFKTPENFGFSEKVMEANGVATVVCGDVSAFYGLFPHTQMCHIFFKRENGLFLVSRFWIGTKLKNPIIRKIILTDETAKGMAEHCCIEYRNLAKKLPLLYREFAEKDN